MARRALLLVLAAQALALALGDVYIMTPSYILDPIPDIPADFGPDLPVDGLDGYLRLADPEDACSPFTFTDFDTPWIALIAREQQLHATNCTFDVKVWNAQQAGALAAIVYDDVYESLIIMSKPKGRPDPYIPSVFVSEKAGIIMRKLMTLDTIRVRITPMSNIAWISMLMSAFLGLIALGVVLATFYVMRSWSMWITGMNHRGPTSPATQAGMQGAGAQPGAGAPSRPGQQQDQGITAEALHLLPVIVYEAPARSRSTRSMSAALPAGPGAASAAAAGADTGGAAGSATASLPESQSRSLLRRMVWADADGEMFERDASEIACGEGDEVEECGEAAGQGDVEEGVVEGDVWADAGDEDKASRSSSEAGFPHHLHVPHPHLAAAAAAGGRVVRPPGAHAGETKRVCAICLEHYEEGDKIRVLPCAHRFHKQCVDQWLGGRRFCPVCKHDASRPLPVPEPPAASSGAARGGGSVNGWQLLLEGFLDMMRAPGTASLPRARAAARARRQQQQQEDALQEPLLPMERQQQQHATSSGPQQQASATGSAVVQRDVEAGLSPAAGAAAALPGAAEGATSSGAAAGPAPGAGTADGAGAPGQAGVGGVVGGAAGAGSRVRAALAGMFGWRRSGGSTGAGAGTGGNA